MGGVGAWHSGHPEPIPVIQHCLLQEMWYVVTLTLMRKQAQGHSQLQGDQGQAEIH